MLYRGLLDTMNHSVAGLLATTGLVTSKAREPPGSGPATGIPGGLPVGVGEPLDGGDHRLDGVGEVVEVDVGEVVGGLVIVGSEAVAGDGLGDDAVAGEVEVVRAPEEVLGGMRVGDERGAVAGESWAEVGALPSGEPELIGTDGGVGLADHLELEIGDDGGERQAAGE